MYFAIVIRYQVPLSERAPHKDAHKAHPLLKAHPLILAGHARRAHKVAFPCSFMCTFVHGLQSAVRSLGMAFIQYAFPRNIRIQECICPVYVIKFYLCVLSFRSLPVGSCIHQNVLHD